MKRLVNGIAIITIAASLWTQPTINLQATGLNDSKRDADISENTAFTTSANVSKSASTQNASGITLGAYVIPTYNYGDEVRNFNNLTGKKLGIAMYYLDWSLTYRDGGWFLGQQLDYQLVAADHPAIMLAWEPKNGRRGLGCNQDYNGGIPPASIAAGGCDTYIRNYARALKAERRRFVLKLAHEMNGSATPYWPGHFGQTPGDYINMFRRVRQLFREEGVSNVEFLWAPNFDSYPNTPGNQPTDYYPGDDVVDWVGINAYNYAQHAPGGAWAWRSLDSFVGQRLKDFACRYPKPQMIHEFGTVEGQNKAGWILDAYQTMQNYPYLRAVVYYNDRDFANANADFRITGSTAKDGGVKELSNWTSAYRQAVSSSAFNSKLPSAAEANPGGVNCGTPPTATPVPPTATPIPPTATPVPPTATPVRPTATSVQPTSTPIPPTATPVPEATSTPVPEATSTPMPEDTATPIPPTATPMPTSTPESIRPTATPIPVPLAPFVISATGENRKIILSWPKIQNAYFYKVHIECPAGASPPAQTGNCDEPADTGETNYVFSGLTNYARYRVQVVGMDGDGNPISALTPIIAMPYDKDLAIFLPFLRGRR